MTATNKEPPAWYVYMVRCVDGSLYAGITTDIERRLYQHNSNSLGAKYTRNRRPVELAYIEPCHDRSQASKREAQIKKLSRLQKLQLIKTTNTSLT
ncbi:GIY-YIG nuclease family protein [Bermanella sp. R86510]|uniref:GIY-YIG nuclease family protein n=1 Tax=unclassified Bermanella TaxID=2627862 RepID=UPI0037CC09C1